MPTTYLLLRNNKQTGPLSLQELLQQGLQPQDLIWMEGQSAGWSYPTEINSLKSYVTEQKSAAQPVPAPGKPTEQRANTETVTRSSSASHIYVALPAGMPPRQEVPATPSLEAQAEALYQRVQAFAQGQGVEDDTETRYARSLEDMKQEYGSWLVQQQKKKKNGSYKKKLLIAASVLVVTTTGFSISKWINSKTTPGSPLVSYSLGTLTQAAKKQPTTVSFNLATDSFTTTTSAVLKSDTVTKAPAKTEIKTSQPATSKKKATTKVPVLLPMKLDSAITSSIPIPEKQPAPEVKKTIPLSRLIIVTGDLQSAKNGKSSTGTQLTLHNNSNELLKSVSVVVNYFKKEDRPVGKETVYFYNVAPGNAPIVNATGNRKATSVRFEIGTIIRSDGSLYLIH